MSNIGNFARRLCLYRLWLPGRLYLERVLIVSARKTTSLERKIYEENL
jgi:hypothetical protein